MHTRGNRFVKIAFILVITAFCATGCGAGLFTYKGSKITLKNPAIQIEDGNHQGLWKNSELSISYQYEKTSDTLKISGTAELVGGNKYYNHLTVYMQLLDAQGIVVEETLIYSAGNNRSLLSRNKDFDLGVPISKEARTLYFVYDIVPVVIR